MEIPESVIAALAKVRETGLTNMLDRPAVVELVEFLDTPGCADAAEWLEKATPRAYMAALNEMGARR